MDWNAIGADLVTRLFPVVVVVAVYYVKMFATTLSPLATNLLAVGLTAALQGIQALTAGGTFNPVETAVLVGLATLLAEVLTNIGAKPAVKTALTLGLKK